jgi:hypothetical protein
MARTKATARKLAGQGGAVRYTISTVPTRDGQVFRAPLVGPVELVFPLTIRWFYKRRGRKARKMAATTGGLMRFPAVIGSNSESSDDCSSDDSSESDNSSEIR